MTTVIRRSVLGSLLTLLMAPVVAQDHVLNLQDADLQVLVSTVADITGRSFILDPSVGTQKVTVISSQPMDEAEIYRVFLSILQVHDLAAVPSGDVTKIVPDRVAAQTAALGAGPEDVITRVLPVTSMPPSAMLTALRPLAPQQANLAALDEAGALVVSDRAANVERLAALVQRIDRGNDQPVEVIRLENANAADLARTLASLYPGGTAQTVMADERTNTLLLSGDPAQRTHIRALVSHLDEPLAGTGASQVVYLRYADAEDMVPLLEASLASLASDPEAVNRSTIQAHGETNAVVISAPPALAREMQAIIRQLDIRREQVLVEAIIAEVSAQTVRELGVQWQLTDGLDDGDGAFGGTNFGARGSGVNILDLALNPAGAASGLNLGWLSGSTSILGEDFLQISFLVRALAQDGNTNILSTPSLVTLDNQEAVIFVGEEIPFVTGQYNTEFQQGGDTTPFQTVQREEVGLKLTVTPHINEGDAVVLDIQQEVSSLSGNQFAVDLTTRKRTLATSVMVPNNTVLVLGGLITDDLMESNEGVPGLSRIPVLGRLFEYENTTQLKRNLVVFIRPRILESDADSLAVSSRKYDYLRAEQLNARERSQSLTPKDEMPLLPELYDYLQTGVGAPSDDG